MTPECRQQIETIFHAALELEADARAAFLARACGSDLSLRQEVESLLACSGETDGIMAAPLDEEALRLIAAGRGEALSGRMLAHFKVLERLGAGGMGVVFVAEDTKLGRRVALKLLPAAFTQDAEQVRRLRREARAASALNHPNIVTVYEIEEIDSLHFITMEFVDGETLRQYLRGSRLGVREAVDIAAQVASALSAAHHAGLVHRDIKPENVMRRVDGFIKVLDFGIAMPAEPPASVSPETAAKDSEPGTLAAIGTASYMSPEQARRETLDARTDLFSLGVLLYEMVAGRRPFTGETDAELLRALRDEEAQPLGVFRQHVPRALEEIVRQALKKDREERYQSASEMHDALRELGRQLKPGTNDEGRSRSTSRPPATVAAASALTSAARRKSFHPSGIFFFLRRRAVRPVIAADRTDAFRGLLPFQEDDQDRFHGRDEDTAALLAMAAREEFRFGVLYGDSGTGKTSLLIAGLLPRLKGDGHLPLYCRSYKDPLAALLEECRQRSRIEPLDGEPPFDYLRRVVAELDIGLLVVCDQFEEFFVNFRTRREREPFVSFVADCHSLTELPVKFLFSLRSDFLYRICSEFDSLIPEPLMGDKRYHLRNFDEEQAAGIIEQSAQSAGLPLEAALCGQVARDLAADDTVLPSELQIIGTQLQHRRIFTLEEYQRAGGKEQLVHNFLEDVIRESGEPQSARLLLRCLISDENTRLTLPLKEIARRTQRSHETVARLLQRFIEARLVREIQEDDPWRYELMHEYLIEQINQSTGKVLDATQRANRTLRQYLSNHSIDKRTRVPLGKLWLIRRYADPELRERGKSLLRRSLRRGLLNTGALALLLMLATGLLAAALSRSEEWEETVLRDGHTAAARRAVFSPDGRLLVSVGEDKRIIVWDFARRERLRALTDHTDVVTAVAFSPDGKWFATGSDDHTVIVWDAARLERVKVLREHRGPVAAVAFSPDERLLASTSGGEDNRTILWQAGEWEKIGEMPSGLPYGTLLFSPNGRQLMTATGEAWNLITGRQVADAEAECGNGTALSPDATRLVCVDGEGDVVFWGLNPAGDLSRRKALDSYSVHRDNGRAVAFSPDGRLVATGAEDIILWDAAAQTRITRLKHTGIVWSLAFSPDNRWLVSSHGDGAILVWDVAERESVADLSGHSAPVRAVAFSSDGRRVVSASEDRSVIVWDAERGQKEAMLSGHSTRVTAVAFSPDGSSVVSNDLDSNLIYWDVSRREPQWTFNAPYGGQGFCVAISSSGRWVATSRGVNETVDGLIVFDCCSNPDPRELINGVYGAAFSADGRRLVFVTEHGKIFLLDTGSWQVVGKAEVSASLISVSFSRDSKWLVTGEDEGAVRLWSVEPLREVATIGRHTARIKSVAFSPDGSKVASASDDKTIALWNVNRRSFITNVGTHSAPVLSVAFSPDGQHLVSGEHDNSVRFYTRHSALWGYRLD